MKQHDEKTQPPCNSQGIKPLHRQLRDRRNRVAISIRKLADITGLDPGNLCVFEQTGKRISLKSVEAICRATGSEIIVAPLGEWRKMEEAILRQANEILELKRER